MAGEEKSVEAIEAKEEKVVKGPTQGPITNFYVDKVVTKEGFVNFIKKQFPDYERHGYTLEAYIGALLRYAHRSLTPYGTDCLVDQRYLTEFITFFKKFGAFERDGTIYYPTGRGISVNIDRDWPILRDLLRFMAYDNLVTQDVRNRLNAEGTELYTTSLLNQSMLIYQREPLPYRKKLHTSYKIDLDPVHMVHMSPKDAAFIRYTPDEKSRERDVVVETTITKYLRKFHPSLTDVQLQQIAEIHKLDCCEGGVHFTSDPQEIAEIYKNGPQSCMSKGDAAYSGPEHPSVMYGNSPGVRLACIPNGTGGYSARCFVYDNPDDPKDKRLIRVYGDAVLQRKLERMGYEQSSWRGVKLRKVQFKDKFGKPLAETFIMPYIDDIVGGNGRDGSAQYVFTKEGWDHWIVCDRVMGAALTCEAKAAGERFTYVSGAMTQGAFGKHVGYNFMRHNSMDVRGTTRYREPGYDAMNEWKEARCRNCGGIFDEEFVKPYIYTRPAGEPKPDAFLCVRCVEHHRGTRWWKIGEGDNTVYVNPGLLFGVHKETKTIQALDQLKWADKRAMEAYEVLFEKDLISKYNVVRLHWAYYADKRLFYPLNKAKEVRPGIWVKLEDIVETIFGGSEAKMATYFLGQSSKGELQYIAHSDAERFLKAAQKGKVFIVDGKLEYVERGAFQPKHRKKYFEVMSELEEEEDNNHDSLFEQSLETTTPLPLIEVINVLWAYFDAHYAPHLRYRDVGLCAQGLSDYLRRAFPKVAADVWYLLSQTYIHMKADGFAGLEGGMSISPQLSMALIQGLLQDGDTEVDEKTGEVFLTQKAVARFAYNCGILDRLGTGASTAYVKLRSEKDKEKIITKLKKQSRNEESIAFNTIQSATRVRV